MGFLDRLAPPARPAPGARQGAGAAGGNGAAGGTGQRRGLFGRPPAPPLDDRERWMGFAAAAATVVAFAVIWVPHLGAAHPKGQPSPLENVGIGVAMAILLAWSAALRKRWLLGLAALWVGFIGPWNHYYVAGYAWVAFGGWLLIKNSKAQVKAAKAEAASSPRGTAGGRGRAGAAGPARASGGAGRGRGTGSSKTDATGRPIPVASKRYTPPAPANKNDHDKRRERRMEAAKGPTKPDRGGNRRGPRAMIRSRRSASPKS